MGQRVGPGRGVGLRMTEAALTILLSVCVWSRSTMAQSCGSRVSARFLLDLPCDMARNPFCNVPGSAYPWHAVRRYIFENQGLVRRMYGDERHSLIVGRELEARRLRYDDDVNLFGQPFTGRAVHKVRPNSRYAARLKNPSATQDGEVPSATFPTTLTTPPTTAKEHVRTPGTLTEVVYHAEPVDAATPTTNPSDSPANAGTTSDVVTEGTLPVSEEEPTSTTPTTAADMVPSYAAGEDLPYEPLPQDPQALLYEETTDGTTHAQVSLLDGNGIDAADSAKPGVDPVESLGPSQIPVTEPPVKKGVNACPVKQEVLAPYWANNTKGDVLALLNVYPFEQYIHSEKCAFENHQMFCHDGCRCEQQFRLHRLLAFDPRNECRGIFADWFRFPSCCVCICYDLGKSTFRAGRSSGR